ncbi:MAG: hypothetical protein CM15mP22_5860 [Gammaproteobacteria bacterium]|nr:MAG: hypothetical protein CM15mP22_5860 [Gammaproteobacteria bacterium]
MLLLLSTIFWRVVSSNSRQEDGYSIVQVPEAEATFVAMNAKTGG